MSRLLFVVFMLLFLDVFAYQILMESIENRIAFPISINDHTFIYQKKDLILDEEEDFRFEEYFDILSMEDPSFHYSLKENTLEVELEGNVFDYPFSYREKEVIEHETIVVQQIPVYISSNEFSSPAPAITSEENSEIYDEPFLELNCSYYSFPAETQISQIISEIRNAVVSNEAVTIDYSLLNTSVRGSYPVVFMSDHGSVTVTVEIV